MKKAFMKKTFLKWVFSYTLVLLLPIIVFSYIYFSKIVYKFDEQTEEIYLQKAEKMSSFIDNVFTVTKELAIKISLTPWANKMMSIDNELDEKMDFYNLSYTDISSELGNYVCLNSVIEDIAVVFPYCETVIRSTGKYCFDDYFNYIVYENTEMQNMVLSHTNKYSYFEMLPGMDINFHNKKSRVITIVHSLKYNTGIPRASLIIYINEKAFLKYAESLRFDEWCRLSVFDTNGRVLGQDGNIKVNDSILLKTLHENNKSVQIVRTGTDLNYVIPSELAPYKYVFTYPRAVLKIGISDTKEIVYYALLFAFIVGFMSVVLFTFRNYNPLFKVISEIVRMNGNNTNLREKQNEYEIIKDSFMLLDNENRKVTKKLSDYETLVKESLLNKLLKGLFEFDDEERRILNEIDIDINEINSFGVIIIKAKEDEETDLSNNFKLVDYLNDVSIIDIIQEIADKNNVLDLLKYVIRIDPITFVVLLCFGERKYENYFEDRMAKISGVLRKNLEYIPNVKFYVVAGDVRNSIAGISKSFQMAERILEWVVFTGDESQLNIEKYLETAQTYYFYPADWEMQIINNLKNSDIQAILKITKEIKYENYVKRNLSAYARKRLLNEMIESGMKVIDELDNKELKEMIAREENINNKTEAELWEYIEKLYYDICIEVDNFREKHTLDTHNKIVSYACENYCNQEISLKLLSYKFNIPEYSVSKAFKSATGVNFHEFISKKRIEKAKEMLEDTEIEIYTIAQEVGFSSDKSFRRSFKRYTGLSPQIYRHNIIEASN